MLVTHGGSTESDNLAPGGTQRHTSLGRGRAVELLPHVCNAALKFCEC
jgi:hypothetical protein